MMRSAKLPGAALELRLRRRVGQAGGDVAERGGRPGRHDQRRRRPAHDRGAEEHGVARLRRLTRRGRQVGRVLLDRQRLARQRGLLDVKIARLEQARVGRDTRSPAASRMTSPGTSSRRGISTQLPSRSTVAVGATRSRSRSAARWER